MGHTPKFCTELAEDKKHREQREKVAQKEQERLKTMEKERLQKQKSLQEQPKANNIFAALAEAEDDENEDDMQETEEYPALSSANITVRAHQMNWAHALSGTSAAADTAIETKVSVMAKAKAITKAEKEKAITRGLKNGTLTWADVSDSDSDDDEYY